MFKISPFKGFVKVDREDFNKFIDSYPVKLEFHLQTVIEPPVGTWNDFTIGDYPESIVARSVECQGFYVYYIKEDKIE